MRVPLVVDIQEAGKGTRLPGPAPSTPVPRIRKASWVPMLVQVSAAAVLSCSLGTESEHAGIIEYRSLRVEGEDRSFVLHIPRGVSPEGAGLILAFHGHGGSGIGFQRSTDLDRIARELGVFIAYPDAASPYWAEDCDCVRADSTHGVADTTFVSAIMDGLDDEFGLHPGRRFAVGFSQGGLFVQRLACQMAERFQAVVEVGSTMALPLAEGCRPARPISTLTVLSKHDDAFPWEGIQQGVFSLLGAEETAGFWGGLNQCRPEPDVDAADRVFRLSFGGCAGGARVELVGTENGGHYWEVSPDLVIRDEVVRFLGG